MRTIVLAFSSALSPVFFLACADAAPPLTAYHVVLARRALAAGERVELKLAPRPPSGTRVYWRAGAGAEMFDLRESIYRAPYIIPNDTRSAEVRADLSGREVGRFSVATSVELIPSSIAGTDECLGPGQSFSTVYGDILPRQDHIPRAEGLVVHMTDAEYPKTAITRGLTATIVVRALICRTGRVLDANVETAYGDDWEPIEHEPVLADAAPAIVRALVFKPVTQSGEAIAAWIHVAVSFRP